MKRKSSWVIIALITKVLSAQQVQVQAIQPNPYFLKSEDIFNLQITNPISTPVEVNIKGIWFLQGQRAVELIGENAILQPGINIFTTQNPGIKSKTYLIKAVDEIETSTGVLPAGKYRACIYLSCLKPDCNGAGQNILASETDPCYEFIVEQPTPLLLSSQPDGNISNNHRPDFNWIPPMPIGSNPDLKYILTLVQKTTKKQSCSDAILRNRPVLKEENISTTLLNYPADMDQLDTGDYAWQVSAVLENYTVATSEAWCFRIEEKKKKQDTIRYIKPQTKLDAGFYTYDKSDQIYFTLAGLYKNDDIQIKIQDEKGNQIQSLTEKTEESIVRPGGDYHSYGDNKYMVNLNDFEIPAGIYLLKIKAAKTEYFIRFMIR